MLSVVGAARQMVMFSATWPLAVHQLAQEFMDPDPVKVCFHFINIFLAYCIHIF